MLDLAAGRVNIFPAWGESAFFRSPCAVLFDAVADAQRDDFADQRKGQRLSQRKLDGAARSNEFQQVLGERFHGRAGGIETNVMFEGAENHQNPLIAKRGHPVLEGFGGAGRKFADAPAHFTEFLTRLFGRGVDVGGDGFGPRRFVFSGLHGLAGLCGDEFIHFQHRGLRRENFLGEHTVDFRVGVEAGVVQHDAAEVEVGGAPQRGKRDAAGRDAEEDQIFDAARAQQQVQLVFGEGADALFVDEEVAGAGEGAVKVGGGRALHEKIVVLNPLESRFGIGNFRMAGGKSESYVNQQKLFLAGKVYGLGRVGDHAIGPGYKSQDPFLKVESKQRRFFRVEFHQFVLSSIISKIGGRAGAAGAGRGRRGANQRLTGNAPRTVVAARRLYVGTEAPPIQRLADARALFATESAYVID